MKPDIKKLRGILTECYAGGAYCPHLDNCLLSPYSTCIECKINLILAMFQPQPAEGEQAYERRGLIEEIHKHIKYDTCTEGYCLDAKFWEQLRNEAGEVTNEIKKQESVRECEHGVANNSHDCISGFIGHKLIGVLFGVGYNGAITMIFDCGAGLIIGTASSDGYPRKGEAGTYWTESPANIKGMVQRKREELAKAQMEIKEALGES